MNWYFIVSWMLIVFLPGLGVFLCILFTKKKDEQPKGIPKMENPPPPPPPLHFKAEDLIDFAEFAIYLSDSKRCRHPKMKHLQWWLKKKSESPIADRRYKILYEQLRVKKIENG